MSSFVKLFHILLMSASPIDPIVKPHRVHASPLKSTVLSLIHGFSLALVFFSANSKVYVVGKENKFFYSILIFRFSRLPEFSCRNFEEALMILYLHIRCTITDRSSQDAMYRNTIQFFIL